jgi:hypothetical protein
MTVDWESVENACESFVRGALQASSIGNVAVMWRDKERKHLTEPYVELSISAETARGVDEQTFARVGTAPNDVAVPRVTGIREFTLQARIRARSQAATRHARNAAMVLRASLNHSALRKVLDDAGVAFQSVLSQGSAVTEYENRRESVHLLDLRFAVKSELYLPDETLGIARRVEITPSFDDAAGDEIEVEAE